jgi:hypothetical protein
LSKADVQSFTILAIAAGAVKTIILENIHGDAGPTIMYLEGLMEKKINEWPESGNPRKNTLACVEHCENLKDHFDSSAEFYTARCLGMLAQTLLVELRDVVKNRWKLNTIDELLECVNKAVDVYDPGESDVEARTEADRLCSLVKSEIGMR